MQMLCGIRRSILASFGFTFIATQAFGAWLSPCATDKLIYSWVHQGFGRTDAIYDPPRSNAGNQLRYVGKVRSGERAYRIYFDAGSNPQTLHGHQDVIVVTSSGKYVGFYEVNDTDLEPLLTKGADIYFEPPEDDPHNRDGARIHFGPGGPPRSVNINGHETTIGGPDHTLKDLHWPEPKTRVSAYCHKHR